MYVNVQQYRVHAALAKWWRGSSAHRDSFHGAMFPALAAAQCFALLPVVGISRANLGSPRFRWLSLRLAYSAAAVTFLGTVTFLAYCAILKKGVSLVAIETMAFYGGALCSMTLFLQLAPRWPSLAMAWARLEFDMRDYGYPRHLGRRVSCMTAVALLLCLVQHLLYVVATGFISWQCFKRDGVLGIFYVYSINNFGPMLTVTDYAPWKATCISVLNVIATVAWNFMDLFIMAISLTLKQRFKQLNRSLSAVEGKNLSSGAWRQFRQTYNSLACLTRTVDEAISSLVLMSFSLNLFFICVHLLQGMKLVREAYFYVYFFYSFGYLVVRTCSTIICAASIHEESQKPRRVLYSVPSESFGSEARRFLVQVTTEQVALTGRNFFFVTRSLMLTLAGTIVSYEVVLIQFEGIAKGSNEPTPDLNGTASCL